MRLPYEQLPAITQAAQAAQAAQAVAGVQQALGQAVYPSQTPGPSAPLPAPTTTQAQSLPQGDIDSLVFGKPLGASMTTDLPAFDPHGYAAPTLPDEAELYGLNDDHTVDYADPYEGLSPLNYRYYNLVADSKNRKRNAANLMAGSQAGMTVQEQADAAKADAVAKARDRIFQNTAHLDNDQFNSWLSRWQAQRGMRVQVPQYTRPRDPNALQLLLGGLAAMHAGQYAPQVFSQVFQGIDNQNERDYARQMQNYQLANAQYNQDGDDLLRLGQIQNQRDVTQAGFDQNAINQRGTDVRSVLGGLDNAQTPDAVDRVFAQLDAIGAGDSISPEQRKTIHDATQERYGAALKSKQDQDRYSKDMGQMSSLESTIRSGDPGERVAAAQQKMAILQRWYPGDPQIDALNKAIPVLQRYTRAEEDKHDATTATTDRTRKLTGLVDMNAKAMVDKHNLDVAKLAWYDKDHQMAYAKSALAMKNIQSEIANRGLMGRLALQKAADVDAGGLSKSDQKMLASEKSALSAEASVLNSQRRSYVQTDSFKGGQKTVVKGHEQDVTDIDARLQEIATRQKEIGSTFAVSRQAAAVKRAAGGPSSNAGTNSGTTKSGTKWHVVGP